MKLGLGLSSHQLNWEHYRFARQCGCTHLMLHLDKDISLPRTTLREERPAVRYAERSVTNEQDDSWTYEQLARLTEEANAVDLQIEAIDDLNPAHTLAALLGSADRPAQMDHFKTVIQRVGEVGIPILIYHFSRVPIIRQRPWSLPSGDMGNVGISLPGSGSRRSDGSTANELPTEICDTVADCLSELLTVAREAGVVLAAQLDEASLPLRHGELPTETWLDSCKKILGQALGASHGMVFNVATTAASGEDVYASLEAGIARENIACLQFVSADSAAGSFPETFADDGAVDVLKIVQILQRNLYEGLIVPGFLPSMNYNVPWQARTAHTLGFLQAALRSSEIR